MGDKLLGVAALPDGQRRRGLHQGLEQLLEPQLSEEQIMVIAGIPREEIRHTRAVQDWLAEGRQEGEANVTLRLLTRRCGLLNEATTARIQALPLEQLETLAEALLDFQGPADLAAWLAAHA
ncbi:DUF4351 domain-containing protein [Synechococcus sp. CBW1107]|uniref:DUF4351 domain-containing protein n=1 Tax=Synechococcus sp. CBW1107 TaxID=2789857 RepID=UPI002AD24921|nr:DUF4351 domain-containing protein [Synechococcus sp. CBW1107]CAK6697907.1 hypothetical protein IFHNHDMJ_02324 [Synechococcus sp. CBW1107]